MKYSRELRSTIYFEVYGYNVVVRRGRKYVRYDGLVLSSFRPISVLASEDVDRSLRVVGRRKYVLVGRSTSNPSIYLTSNDTIVYVYDRKLLKKVTGKELTIPERIRMRLSTLSNVEDGFRRCFWSEIPYYVGDNVVSSGVYPVVVSFLFLYRSGKGGLGLKMVRYIVDEGMDLDLRWVDRLKYQFGYVFSGFGYVTVVPMYSRYVTFSNVHDAFASSRSRKGRSQLFSEEDLWFDDDYEEGINFF